MSRIPERPPPPATVQSFATPAVNPDRSRKREAPPAPPKDTYESAPANSGAVLFGAPANSPNARGMGDVKAAEQQADQKELASRVGNLASQSYPQDKHPGSLHEAERIRHGETPDTWTESHAEQVSGGDSPRYEAHPQQNRKVPTYMLENTLMMHTRGEALTPFEKKMVEDWGKGKMSALTPISESDPPHKLVGYKVEDGPSGYTTTKYYDRQGNELAQGPVKGGHAESTAAPWDYVNLARAGVGVAKAVGKSAAKQVAKTPHPSASGKTDIGRASTQPAAAPPPSRGRPFDSTVPGAGKNPTVGQPSGQPAANQPPAARGAQTVDTRGGQTVDSRGGQTANSSAGSVGRTQAPAAPFGEPTVYFHKGRHYKLYPQQGDQMNVTVQTPKGPETMKGIDYRLRLEEARAWVSSNSRGDTLHTLELHKQAQAKFGLNDRWQSNANPIERQIRVGK